MVVNKTTAAVEVEHDLPITGGTHAQFRRVRMTAAGTYLAPFLLTGRVVEYDKNFHELRTFKVNTPWAAIRLHNGNTLITDERDRLTRELNPKGETVWEYRIADMPAEIRLSNCQSCVRLANGNTVFCSNKGERDKSPQLVEVTPDKKVVWVLKDFRNVGGATAVQILDDPGVPEKPGDLQR